MVRYITVLLAAAFVLLFLTFGMELRQHRQIVSENQEQIEDLNEQTTSAVQKLNNIVAENEKLKDQLRDMEQLEEENDTLKAEKETNERAVAALDYFWQINEAYVKGRRNVARSLIEELEELQLQEFLPRESVTANDRFSPYDRYQEIREKLF